MDRDVAREHHNLEKELGYKFTLAKLPSAEVQGKIAKPRDVDTTTLHQEVSPRLTSVIEPEC